MAQMTVAAALAEQEPDTWEAHLADTLAAGRGLCDAALAEALCRAAPERMREMDGWGVGWARSGGHIRQVTAPGHRRRRCCYVDFLNTGTGGGGDPAQAGGQDGWHPRSQQPRDHRSGGEGRVGARRPRRRARRWCGGRRRSRGDGDRDRRAHQALRPVERFEQHGGRRLRACDARRRGPRRHGVRAVLPRSATWRRVSSGWTPSCGTRSGTSSAGGFSTAGWRSSSTGTAARTTAGTRRPGISRRTRSAARSRRAAARPRAAPGCRSPTCRRRSCGPPSDR